MTPEQTEEWRSAVNPLNYLDFHAVSEAGLRESWEYLTGRGVPGWAIHLREHYISLGWEQYETWVPEFAFRSEVALVGLQILYPTGDARADVYKRVLLGFFYEALKPFEEWMSEPERGSDNDSLLLVRQFYEKRHAPILESEWFDALKKATRAYRHAASQASPEIIELLYLVSKMLRDWQGVLLRPSEHDSWWKSARSNSVSDLANRLNKLHQWRVNGKAGDTEELYTELLARTYLAALEAECPAPDWMPYT